MCLVALRLGVLGFLQFFVDVVVKSVNITECVGAGADGAGRVQGPVLVKVLLTVCVFGSVCKMKLRMNKQTN